MKRVATHHRFVDLLLLGVALAWGSTYLTVKDLTRHSSVLGLLATRFGITTLVLLVLSYRQLRGFTRREVFVGSILGVSQAFILFLEAFGVSRTSATNGGLIISWYWKAQGRHHKKTPALPLRFIFLSRDLFIRRQRKMWS